MQLVSYSYIGVPADLVLVTFRTAFYISALFL